MAQYNIPSPPSTSDPKKISDYLRTLCDEYLPHMFNNIDEDNLSEDILEILQQLVDKVANLESLINNITGQE